MAGITISFDENLNMNGKGSLLEVENIFGRETNFAQGIGKTVALYQLIDKEYKKAVGNDGKIVGSERTDILTQIDRFFNSVILIWKRLAEANSVAIRVENPKADFWIQIDERNGIWEAQGRLAKFFVVPVKNFQDIYANKLAPEIVALLKRYAEAAEDGVIDEEETNDLKNGMRQVIYYTLFLRTQIEQCLVHN